jgi:predicted lactoylglutathione lyase
MLNIKFSSIPFKDVNSAKIFYNAIGKKIKDIKINDDALYLLFEDGYQIMIYDNKQECCEERFMSTDDDLEYVVN